MRNEFRFLANAFTRLADEFENETEVSLRDISKNGLSLKSEEFLNVEPNSVYEIVVVPEKEAKLEKFKLKIESRWVKINKSIMEGGFSIVLHSDHDEFKKYLEYLEKKKGVKQLEKEKSVYEDKLDEVVM